MSLTAGDCCATRLWILQGQPLQAVVRQVGNFRMTVIRREITALAVLLDQLACAPTGAGELDLSSPHPHAGLLTAPGNTGGSCPHDMALSSADIGIQLLMDSTVILQEIEARITARAFEAVHHPDRGPAVRAVLEQLLAVLDDTSPDGLI